MFLLRVIKVIKSETKVSKSGATYHSLTLLVDEPFFSNGAVMPGQKVVYAASAVEIPNDEKIRYAYVSVNKSNGSVWINGLTA